MSMFPLDGCVDNMPLTLTMIRSTLLKTSPRKLSQCWIYQAIHLKAFPKESYGMATYMYYILQVAERKGRFDVAFEYDGQYRIWPAEYLLPWEFSAMTFTASVRPTSNSSIRNSPFVPAITALSMPLKTYTKHSQTLSCKSAGN